MPLVELRADYDRDGSLAGGAEEYAARGAGLGAVVAANLDRDDRSLPSRATLGSPVPLDWTRSTKSRRDRDPVTLEVVVAAAAAVELTSLALRISGRDADAIALIDARSTLVRPTRSRGGQVEFRLPLEAGAHSFRLESKRVAGSPLGGLDGALRLAAVGRRPDGSVSTLDEARLTLARFVALGDFARAEILYVCRLPDNEAALADLRRGMAGVRPRVRLREVGPEDCQFDGWLQDQFQLGYLESPAGTMLALLHMPRLRANALLSAQRPNLATLVRAHFPSRDIGLIEDFWERRIPMYHQGGTLELPFRDSGSAYSLLKRPVDAHDFLRQELGWLLREAEDLEVNGGSRVLPAAREDPASAREDLRNLGDRIGTVVEKLKPAVSRIRRDGLDALRARTALLVGSVERALPIGSSDNRLWFGLSVGNTPLRLDGSQLNLLYTTLGETHDALVYGGNLEVSPPTGADPFGKVVVGEGEERGMDMPLRNFLRAGAAVQPVVTLDTGWLEVGHVDELVAFLPGQGRRGHAVLRASPEIAMALMERAAAIYRCGLPVDHDDNPIHPSRWRPSQLRRHSMRAGQHPVTRLLRGKYWLHTYPLPSDATGGDPDLEQAKMPPRFYREIVDHYDGYFESLHVPFYPARREPAHSYPAAFTALDFEYFDEDSNRVIVEQKLLALDKDLEGAFPDFELLRVPVLLDRLSEEQLDRVGLHGLGPSATSALTPDLVNLQLVNGTAFVPKPFGPRMRLEDAACAISAVLAEQGLKELAGRAARPQYLAGLHPSLLLSEAWLSPAVKEGQVDSPFRSLNEVAAEFQDGFPGLSVSEVAERIARRNKGAFDEAGRLRLGWCRLTIPESTVDLFQAYTQVLLHARGLRVSWIDSWFYHLRAGGIHCGTNVLRTPPRRRPRWWQHPELARSR